VVLLRCENSEGKEEGVAKEEAAIQASLPGINRKRYAYEGLLRDNPEPTNFKEADAFLRKYTVTTMVMRKDHDAMRVVLKELNADASKEKHEWNTELSIFNREERETVFLELAIRAHTQWLELEAPKYK
jgi:hypothetical protein